MRRLSAGAPGRSSAPAIEAASSAGAFSASAWAPGRRSWKRTAEWPRNVRIRGPVSISACSAGTELVIVSWMNGRATLASEA